MQIDEWLDKIGLGRYRELFADHDIDLQILPELSEPDFEKLGISLGHRKKLLKAIAALADAPPRQEGGPPAMPGDGSPSEAERRQLTVMFVDLVNSTELTARLDPEDMGRVIRSYQACCAEIVNRWEGHIAKYMGDGVQAYFGYPRAHEDDAERAVRAGLELTAAVAGLKGDQDAPLATRIGIATGLVMVGDLIGEQEAQERAVVGDTPNLAARLQALAEPGAVVIAATSRRLVSGSFELQDLGHHDLKGFAEPTRAWRVRSERAVASRFEARHLAGVSPIVGRENELALLRDRWASAVEGEGQVILLSGEAGIGKSRIARSLIESLAAEPHLRLRYQCSPYHSNSAFHPMVEQLQRSAGFERSDPPATKLDKLEALLARAGERAIEAAPIFAALLAIPTGGRYPDLSLNAQRQKQRTLEVLVDQIEALAAHRPVLMICEDAHWIDPSTQEALTLLVDHIERMAVLLIMTFRPEITPPWTRHAHVTQLSLNRIGRRQGVAIVQRLMDGKTLPAEVTDQILLKADGVPLFIEELTKAVRESGLLSDVGDRYELAGPLPPLAIPATLQDSLMARLDRLAPVKEVAQVASVIGREFSHEVLVAIYDRRQAEIDTALDQLVSSELIFRRGTPPEATYSFKHALVQETAYRSLLRGKRQFLHGRIAEFLRQRSPQTAELQPELLAHHFGEAGFVGPAAECWLKAGRRARDRYANQEAKAHLQKALELAAKERPDAPDAATGLATIRRDALVLLGDLAGLGEDLDQANASYQQALAEASDAIAQAAIRNKLHRPNVAIRNRARIVFYEHGSGEHTLLFVNPIVYGLAVFQPILEQLCEEFRIVTVDCRGTGASDPLTRPFPLREHVADVAAVIETLGRSGVVGVGISRGSNLLIMLAISHPRLITKLVTVGCPLVPPASAGRSTFSSEYLRQRAAAYEKGDVEALLRIQSSFVYTEPGTEKLRQWAVDRRLQLPPDTIMSFYDPDPGADVTPLLDRLMVPTLVTHGTQDQLVSFPTAEYLARAIPNAQLYGFEDKGHLPIFTATEEFCAVLRRFVRQEAVNS
jgi:class 3 adenylate cyclase/pimeloyl-ACP methyl ester carboxylesterase